MNSLAVCGHTWKNWTCDFFCGLLGCLLMRSSRVHLNKESSNWIWHKQHFGSVSYWFIQTCPTSILLQLELCWSSFSGMLFSILSDKKAIYLGPCTIVQEKYVYVQKWMQVLQAILRRRMPWRDLEWGNVEAFTILSGKCDIKAQQWHNTKGGKMDCCERNGMQSLF